MQTRGKMKSRPRCTSCGSEFSWPTPGSQPTQLFPLVCGDILCRSCLAQRARATLASLELVPLQCCQRVVPFDYIQEVLEHAEHVYYSFLLNRAKCRSGDEKVPASEKTRSESFHPISPMGDEGEMKLPASTVTQDSGDVAAVTTARTRPTTASHPSQESKQRYVPRNTMGRFVVPDLKVIAAPSRQIACQMCRSTYCRPQLEAPCGHDLCRNCVHARVTDQLRLDAAHNGIGLPISCCDKVLPLDVVQRVITGRDLTSYAKMMVKHDSSKTSTTSTSKRGTKRKATPEAKSPATARKTPRRQPPASSLVLRSAKQVKAADTKLQVRQQVCCACYRSVKGPTQWFMGPCGHGYCRSCMTTMATMSLKNRQQIPIRCCSTEFPIDYVQRVLSKAKFEEYGRFLREMNPSMSTLQSDHVYAELVRQQRGKQCPACGIGVLKISGCQTMRCCNGHYFCWGCGGQTCICAGVRVAPQA